VGYVAALAISILAFGTILYLDRRQANLNELDVRLEGEADVAIRLLAELSKSFGRLPPILESAQATLQSFRHYVVLIGRDGAAKLTIDPTGAADSTVVERLRRLALAATAEPQRGTAAIVPGRPPLRYYLADVRGADPDIRAVLVGAGLDEVLFGPADLLRTMLYVGPVILLVSILVGSSLARTSLKPLEATIDELTAITDGKSLHRRLPVDPSSTDELARMSHAVNGMFARLEGSFAAQQRFVAEASHELKTPLMVLRAGVERALTNPKVPAESLEPLDESLEEINRMSELVDSLLTLARADEGRAPLAVDLCDLRELVSEAGETANILAEANRIVVRTEIPSAPVILPVDRNRIRQLLLNLVTNAVKYTAAGGEVDVGLVDHGAVVQIEVRDTGVGIAAGDLPHIFDRFWRADPARTRDEAKAGTGLGLAITKWIAEAHGGTITVHSRPSRGTVFTVSLPRSPSAAPVEGTAEDTAAVG
jgi:signal transduction histidine kinase